MSKKPIPSGYATLYANMLPSLIPVARKHGYCFAIHGSLAADLDAVCVPWIEDASDEDELIQALSECIGGYCLDTARFDGMPKGPTIFPHNRRCYTVCFGGAAYMDITVVPKAPIRKEAR